MTSQQWTNAVIAVVLGSIVAVVLLVPVAAVLYRRRGEMTFGSLVVLLAAGVYGVALWTYTLVPFPATVDYTCTSPILEPFQSFRNLRANGVRTPQLLAANPYFWQTALNVALFVPFGYFVRRVLGGGFFVAGVLGFTTSLLIEATQLTGVWGVFRCSYRFFELDDLMTNTAGAVIGSIFSIALVGGASARARARGRAARPAEVTLGRRWMGLVCDLLWTVGASVGVSVAFRVWHLYGPGDEAALGGRLDAWLGWTVAAALQGLVVIGAGRTLGEWTVALRTEPVRMTSGSRHTDGASGGSVRMTPPARHTDGASGGSVRMTPLLVLPRRVVKYALGVGGFIALAAWDGPSWALPAFVVITVVGTVPRGHGGLSNWLAGLKLRT